MVEIFLDTANLGEIQEIKGWNTITGLTTNQKIFEKEKGCNFETQAKKIIAMMKPLPVSLEGPNELRALIKTAEQYHSWGKNVVIKVPMLGNGDGLRAVKELSEAGIKTNVTACMTLNQTFLACSAGATYVSLFNNRMKDWQKEELNGKQKNKRVEVISKFDREATLYAQMTIANTMDLIENSDFKTKLIIGSIRKPIDIEEILVCGPSIITIPTKILKEMPYNSMTEKSLKEFEEAWQEFLKCQPKNKKKR